MSILFLTSIFFIPNGFAQDYMKWELPENAILRIGKGTINDLKHSPDGDLIAVATHIGVWIYDANSGKEIRLLKHTEWVTSIAKSLLPEDRRTGKAKVFNSGLTQIEQTKDIFFLKTPHSESVFLYLTP